MDAHLHHLGNKLWYFLPHSENRVILSFTRGSEFSTLLITKPGIQAWSDFKSLIQTSDPISIILPSKDRIQIERRLVEQGLLIFGWIIFHRNLPTNISLFEDSTSWNVLRKKLKSWDFALGKLLFSGKFILLLSVSRTIFKFRAMSDWPCSFEGSGSENNDGTTPNWCLVCNDFLLGLS